MNIQEFIKAKIKEFDKQFVVHCSDGDILGTDKSNEVRKAKHFLSQSLIEYNEKIKDMIERTHLNGNNLGKYADGAIEMKNAIITNLTQDTNPKE